ncbi:MAG: TIGR03016 family PEP-CTERM system-associated outer membrane protein [Colwellia sp.]
MAIMVMATVKNSNSIFALKNVGLHSAHADLQTKTPKGCFFVGRCLPRQSFLLLALLLSFLSVSTFAGEWQFTPNLVLDETYTDNVELTIKDAESSFVTQTIAGLEAAYQSRIANLTLSGTTSYAMYSHNSDLNDDFRTLGATGQYNLWTNGPAIIASASIANISRNTANNSLADLVSGDTIESESYSTGIQYKVKNSSFLIDTSLIYSINRTEDNIGESDGYTAQLSTENGSNARHVYWQIKGDYSKREQDYSGVTSDGENYTVDAMLGAITSFNVNPFIRFYDEDVKGSTTTNQNSQTTASLGSGIRWLASPHIIIDLSYNFVEDETISDDYISANINWEPSARTSLAAGYSQRFFGKSYDLDFEHKTKRLTNSISYHENLEIFDRNSYQQIILGSFWCPTDGFTGEVSQCAIQPDTAIDENYQFVTLSSFELIESNEFSLNKNLAWSSKLQLSRTSFALNILGNEREGLQSGVIDQHLDAGIAIERKISGKSNFTISANFRHEHFDKENPQGSRQEDYYRTVSATYTKKLASSLSTNFTIQHVNRGSSEEQYNYDEMRAIINLTKEF